jgi:hypothetical protein
MFVPHKSRRRGPGSGTSVSRPDPASRTGPPEAEVEVEPKDGDLKSGTLDQHRLLQLWLRLNRDRKLSSLVLVPAHPGGSAVPAARAIARAARIQGATGLQVIEAEGLRPGKAADIVRDMNAALEASGTVVVAVDSVLANPVSLEVAVAAREVVLCVALGSTDLASARRTIDLVGRERFVGSIVLGAVDRP